jgi:type IV pilus assembly protein PilA
MRNDSQGFTLIELLIVIAILTVLSTMALPSYQDRVIRAQAAQAMAVAEVAKKEVEEYYKAKKALPRNNAQAGLPAPEKMVGNYVTSVAVSDGVINITLGNRVNKNAAGKIVTMRPAIVADASIVPIAWVCGYASVPKGMTVKGKNESTIPPRQLPIDCRY